MILAEEILELAQKKDINDVEVYQVQSYSRPISFEANRLKQVETSQSTAVALRLWQNNRPGLAVAYGDFNPEDLIAKAITISQLQSPQEIFLNPKNHLTYSTNGSQPDINELIEQGKKTIELIREKYPEVIVNLDWEWEKQTTTLINSRGLDCRQTDTSQSVSLGIELVKDEDFLGIYDGEYDHDRLDLDKMLERLLLKLAWAEQNANISSSKMPVLFTNNAIVTLWETLTEALNGKYILDKSSPWSDSLGKNVISDCLSLRQQPDLQPYDCPFDDEGTVTKPLELISQGNLMNIYTDQKTASQLKINNTGNGFRPSLGSYPTPDLVNLVVNQGDSSFQQLVSSVREGIIVDQILGGGADISGDFSFNIDLGYRVKNGEIIGRVKDTMLAGNVYQALNQVVALGNDRLWAGSCYTPSMVIDGLSIISHQ